MVSGGGGDDYDDGDYDGKSDILRNEYDMMR